MTTSPTPPDPLELLVREDKWQLGAGDGVIFAPPFPLWLDRPGFWDDATIHHWRVGPLFTVAFLDDAGKEVTAQATARRWTPAELIVEYRLANGMQATEVRTVHPGGIFVSEWRLRAFKRGAMHLVAWTRHDAGEVNPASLGFSGALVLERRTRDDRGASLTLRAELGCAGGATSWMALGGEHTGPHPEWRLTPFVERWRADGLPRTIRPPAGAATVYAAVHREVALDGESGAAVFALRLAPAEPAFAAEPPAFAAQAFTLGGVSRRRWRERFEDVPPFRCADPYLESYYWYRWYTALLNAAAPAAGALGHPTVLGGPGPFHVAGAESAASIVRDLRWLSDPSLARGTLRVFLDRQAVDGSLPSTVRATGAQFEWESAAAARWGDALLAIHDAWPDAAFLAESYARLAAHARWLVKTHDPGATGIFAPASGTSADTITATCAAAELFHALDRASRELRLETDTPVWTSLTSRSASALRSTLWDPEEMLFRAPDRPDRMLRARAFAPWVTGVADERHVPGLTRHLLDRARFWTPFPAPSFVSREAAEADDEDTRVRGRVDPATDCLLVDALAGASRHAPELRAAAAHLLRRLVHMMFHDGELQRPNAYEHYNPFTGHASVHRGLDDLTRGWVADLIIGHAAGARPQAGGIVIDPLPLGLEFVEFGPAIVRGRELRVRIDGERVRATAGGVDYEAKIGTPVLIPD